MYLIWIYYCVVPLGEDLSEYDAIYNKQLLEEEKQDKEYREQYVTVTTPASGMMKLEAVTLLVPLVVILGASMVHRQSV